MEIQPTLIVVAVRLQSLKIKEHVHMDKEIVIEKSIKQTLKTERLNQLKARIFNTQMDIESYKAINEDKRLEVSLKQLDDLGKAYWAIDAILIEDEIV